MGNYLFIFKKAVLLDEWLCVKSSACAWGVFVFHLALFLSLDDFIQRL